MVFAAVPFWTWHRAKSQLWIHNDKIVDRKKNHSKRSPNLWNNFDSGHDKKRFLLAHTRERKKKPTPNITANEQKWRFLLVDLIGFHAFLATIATTMVIYYHCLGHKAPEYCVTATTHQSIDCTEQRHYKNYVNGSLSIHFEIYNKYNRLQGQSILN